MIIAFTYDGTLQTPYLSMDKKSIDEIAINPLPTEVYSVHSHVTEASR